MRSTGCDIVIGNRMMDTSSMPLVRILTNRFMSALISVMAGQRVPDSQSGFRLIRCEVLRRVELKSSNYEIESEMIIRSAKAGFRIESAPIRTIYSGEKSRINPVIDALRFVFFVFKTSLGR